MQPRAQYVIDTVERAYSLDHSDERWLDDVLGAAHRDLALGSGTYAFTCRVENEGLQVGSLFAQRDLDPKYGALFAAINANVPPDAVRRLARTHCVCDSHERFFGAEHVSVQRFRRIAGPAGFADALSLFVQDDEGHAVDISAPSTSPIAMHPRVRAMWNRVGMHIVSAWRLRRRLAAHALVRDAMLDTRGRVHDLAGDLSDDREARRVLAQAVTQIDRARSRERADPETALGLWQGLVAGRWSLVDHWERDGRRFIAAYRNLPELRDPRALGPRERSIVRYVWLGASNKEIAFALGIPFASVTAAVRGLLKKLRCARREDLVALGDPASWAAETLSLGRGDLAVAYSGHADTLPMLTAAERAIVARVVAGDTNAAIAKRRKTSIHTVANQLQAIYRRLGVRSRAELVRRATGR